MQESTVTTKGQTTLPREVREALGLKPGDRIRYLVLDNGQVRILKPRSVMSLAGLLHREGRAPVTLEDMEAAIARSAQG
ncbi:MAG: AbrB/MazE/SpoVT family DNA-binding domain-containing protein [Rhodobacteraceae bacterium]|nr:MAG: AbrB/MazE/SpoVT family DNA-binding domain-containing protein [Paracoccaceae bacterium]